MSRSLFLPLIPKAIHRLQQGPLENRVLEKKSKVSPRITRIPYLEYSIKKSTTALSQEFLKNRLS
jgi:hypothetical protein